MCVLSGKESCREIWKEWDQARDDPGALSLIFYQDLIKTEGGAYRPGAAKSCVKITARAGRLGGSVG